MKFRFSSDFVVDSDVEPWCREGLRIGMLGGPGSGKSWNNSILAEQFLQQGGTVVIFQPRDEYFTLKEKFDVLSVGGVHAKDMEFALTSPSLYAKAVVEDGISIIFYTSAVDDEEKLVDWVSRFLRLILRYQEQHHRPLLIIVEEAHEYMPRSPSGHVAPPWIYNRMIKAFKDCFTDGRKLNIIAVASSQRPQELNFTIRQLANLSFYGKFSSQDIKYVEKECLQYVRKQFEMKGNEVIMKILDASRLLDLKMGEWLVIIGKQAKFIIVTEKRLTKHGAETPRLEYVAPRPTETKKTIDELAKSIMVALEKEETEKSELEKAKRKIHDLEAKLQTSEEKANIKLSVKEMLSDEKAAAPPGFEPGIPSKEDKKDKESKEKLLAENKQLLEDLKTLDARFAKLQKETQGIEKIREGFKDLGLLPTPIPTSMPNDRQIGLQVTTSIVDVQSVEKFVTINTDSIKGKVLALAKTGFLDKWQGLGDIHNALVEKFKWSVAKSSLQTELNRMVGEFLGSKKDKGRRQTVYSLAEGVKFKETT